MSSIHFGDPDDAVEREVVENVRIEEEETDEKAQKKRRKIIKGIEEKEALDEQPPEFGYPDDTMIPGQKEA